MKRIKGWQWWGIMALALAAIAPKTAWAGCGNTALGGPGHCESGNCDCDEGGTDGGSRVRLADGCVQRGVLDLAAFNPVGALPMEFRRTYYSRYLWWGRYARMGRASWRTVFDLNLYAQNFVNGQPNQMFFMDEAGNGYKFVRLSGSNQFRTGSFYDYSPDALFQWTSDPTRFTLVKPDGREFDFARVRGASMPSYYGLEKARDRHGNETIFTYDNGYLQRVQDPVGRGLNFTYHPNGTLAQVQADDGRFVQFSYTDTGGGVMGLTQATYDDATTATYTYSKLTEPDGVSRPLLLSARDVRYGGDRVGAQEVYEYDPNIHGMVWKEKNLVTSEVTYQFSYKMNANNHRITLAQAHGRLLPLLPTVPRGTRRGLVGKWGR